MDSSCMNLDYTEVYKCIVIISNHCTFQTLEETTMLLPGIHLRSCK